MKVIKREGGRFKKMENDKERNRERRKVRG